MVGAAVVSGHRAEPAGERAIQLAPGPRSTSSAPTGTPLTSPVTVTNPTITAPDGGNTSFFVPGQIARYLQPSVPGRAGDSSTNLVPTSQLDLPSFFGTSSAAPNAAAVAALMLDVVPGLTPAEIRAGHGNVGTFP